jgi:hypothetical protein
MALTILAAPTWLMADLFTNFRLRGDDFPYLAESRSAAAVTANVWMPHNAHVVPLFRLLTYGLIFAASKLEHIPMMLEYASAGVFILVIAAMGLLVSRESRNRALGLAAMAFGGITTVMLPAATWYSASQTLWAGLGIVLMLLFLQSWRARGGLWRLGLAGLLAFASPAFWSGGYAAGPVGFCYLWFDGRLRCRKASAIPFVATILAAILGIAVVRQAKLASDPAQPPTTFGFASILVGVSHTSQAIPEALVANNLGIELVTTPSQSAVFCLAAAAVWAWTRGRARPTSLEAAGAVLVGTVYLMAYTFRSQYEFENLRDLGWYHALPQIGAALFAAGWWSVCRPASQQASSPPSWNALCAVALLALTMLALHAPRAQRLFEQTVYPMSPSELRKLPIPSLQRMRALYLASVTEVRQRRALTRFDHAEQIARRLRIGRSAIRRSFGQAEFPSWPPQVVHPDAFDLLDLPEDGTTNDPALIRASLAVYFQPEPEERPDWLDRGEPWPPRQR